MAKPRKPKGEPKQVLQAVTTEEKRHLQIVGPEYWGRPRTRADCEPCPTCEQDRIDLATAAEATDGDADPDTELTDDRPDEPLECGHLRSDAHKHCRPCGFVSCRYHLLLDIDASGKIWIQRARGLPKEQREELLIELLDRVAETCALDVADRGRHTTDQVAALIGVNDKRTEQIQQAASEKADLGGLLEPFRGVPGDPSEND